MELMMPHRPVLYDEPHTPRGLARQGGMLRVICTSARCTHEAIIAPRSLIQKGYGDIHLSVIAKRLKCTRCGAVRPTVQLPLW